MNNSGKYLIWALLSVIGAFALGYIALNRGEQINALWIVVAAVCVYLIAYRFYGLYIAKTVLGVDPTRMTPAVRHNDGLDYVPTDKKVLFGHHFAAIAGAGPLVGPVLAAQMGYLPGMIWILAGVVLAGAVQDFMVLFVSTRRDGRSLGELASSRNRTFAYHLPDVGHLPSLTQAEEQLALKAIKRGISKTADIPSHLRRLGINSVLINETVSHFILSGVPNNGNAARNGRCDHVRNHRSGIDKGIAPERFSVQRISLTLKRLLELRVHLTLAIV